MNNLFLGRSPCGERGLKYQLRHSVPFAGKSLPVRGAWVEIVSVLHFGFYVTVAPRAGSVG